MDRGDVDLTIFEKHLAAEARTALERGGLLSALLGLVGGGAVLALTYSGAVSNVDSAAVFAFAAGFYSVVFYLLARAGRLKGSMLYVAFMPFVSLPTVFFVLSHFQMPAGAATFLTGPISYLYFHLIIMTGFVFDKRLSILAGIVCAIEYQAAYLLARNGLAGITAEDPTLLQDLTSGPLYSIKAIMMVFAGFVVAALSQTVRRVIEKAVREEQQKERISRLFGQYVSPEVKDRIVSEKAEVSGERKSVVVLFSDLRGFSGFSEGHDAEFVVSVLNEYFDTMVACIQSHGGVVDKFMGDAVMAAFGGLIPLDNPAHDAVAAALEMRVALQGLNERNALRGVPRMENGIGLHFGEVLQGPIGSRNRKEFTVIGDAVNIASRLEGLTRQGPGRIYVSGAVHDRLPPDLQGRCRAVGPTLLKGKQKEVLVFAVE